MQELDLHILRKLNQTTTQKSLADEIGVSVGKLNYILNALIDKGLVKSERFLNSKNKIQYTNTRWNKRKNQSYKTIYS